MKVILKILACLVAGCMLFSIMTALKINADMLSEDSVLIDSQEEQPDQQALYEELFDPNSVVEIEIHIAREQIADIQKDYEYYRKLKAKSTTYRIADSVTFTVNGRKYVIEEVGIRMKGENSRCNFYNDILGIYNLINLRISFNQTFDDTSDYGLDAKVWSSDQEREQRRKRTFATLKSMELKWNQTADNTYVRNQYVNEVFRSYGIPAQKCCLSTLSVSGCKLGIYKIFEPIDEQFIHRNFPQSDWGGDLYKARGTSSSIAAFLPESTYGIAKKQKAEFYNYDLKTNTDQPNHESMRQLIEVVNREGVTKDEIDKVADTDELALFLAINFAMGNQDDMRCNYNNYFVYFRKSDGKAVFIPYDCEIVMGDIYSWNPPGNGMTELSPYFMQHADFDFEQANPLVCQVITRNGCYNGKYQSFLREIAQSKWMKAETFRSYYNPAAANYGNKVISKYNFMSTMNMNLDFSLEGGDQCNGNMSVEEFMEKMKKNIMENTD